MKEEIRGQLNDRQYEAVTAIDGPVLVIAGAGSGKTRVIEFRVLHLVETGVNPASIILLTFTRRSAQEMISRAASHDPRCQSVEGGTFHSFANKILRRYSEFFSLPNTFTVYDEADAEEAIHRCAVRLGFYAKEKRRPRKDMLRKILSMALNKEMTIEEILQEALPDFRPVSRRDQGSPGKVHGVQDRVAVPRLRRPPPLPEDPLENEEIRGRISERYPT